MATTTLDAIESALFAQLKGLSKEEGGPFDTVARFSGEVTRDKGPSQAGGGVPASLLLALEGETFSTEGDSLALGPWTTVATSVFRIYVCAIDLAGHEHAVKGEVTGSNTGLYHLLSRATAAVAGLDIASLYQNGRIELLDTRPFYIKSGTYVYVIRCKAEREVLSVDAVDVSFPITRIDADVNVADEDDAEANPLNQFQAETAD